jgi:prepilin-type N-terminal cleavage/methylation domain-containing protein
MKFLAAVTPRKTGNYRKLKGFTLVELIVVIAIIGVLMAILIPNLITYINDAKQTRLNVHASNVYKYAHGWLIQANIAGVWRPGYEDFFSGHSCSVGYVPSGNVPRANGDFNTPTQPEPRDGWKPMMDFDSITTAFKFNQAFRQTMTAYMDNVDRYSKYSVIVDSRGNIVQSYFSEGEAELMVGGYPEQRLASQVSENKTLKILAEEFKESGDFGASDFVRQ